MQCSVLATGSHEWDAAVRKLPVDVYHLPGYAALCQETDGGRAVGFLATEGDRALFVPLILRPVPEHLCDGNGSLDAIAPYGYAGPLLVGDAGGSGAFLECAVGRFVDWLRDERVVSAFLRLHPLMPIDESVLDRFGPVVDSGQTVAIDLSLSDDERWRSMRSNHRRDVTRSVSRGEQAAVDETWEGLPAFVEAYHETMGRVGARSYYRFPVAYFEDLRKALDGHIHLWTVRRGADVLGGALLTECNGIVQYHLGGTRTEFLSSNPLKLLFRDAASWFKSRGNRWFHLGGGVAAGDNSLLHFKLGFSPLTFPFRTWRLVTDASAYAAFTQRAGGASAGSHTAAYFPEYRRAVSS